MRRSNLLLFLSLFCNPLFAQIQRPFEAEIRAFERLDSLENRPKAKSSCLLARLFSRY